MRKILYFIFVSIFSLSVYGQSITITAPNGNEFWQAGKTPSITWDSSGLSSNIDLEYSLDNGNSWISIATVPNTNESYEWTIPNTASLQSLVRATSNTTVDTSNNVFEISQDTSSCTIVVLGSSTSLGTGADPIENSWVNLYHTAIFQKNTKLNVINLSTPGYTTYHILPTGTTIPNGVNVTIDEDKNITKALSHNPTAIIINMPSNDTNNGYTVNAQLENYDVLNTSASNNSTPVPVWIATPQPRNSFDASENQIQTDVRDALITTYLDKSIDFWDGIADVNGNIIESVHAGDGIHVNNIGHEILFNRVLNKNIAETTCLSGSLSIEEVSTNYVNGLKIHPNPAKDHVNIDFTSEFSGELNIELYDILGRKLLENNANFSVGINSVNLILNQNNSLSSKFIFGTLTFTTDNKIVQKSVKLVLN
ncbi:SGNH/GDSL hydrolase family protein [Confluentibacter citreus]|uniref:SGNH/GDSL hydrolase family protein n=1 Tax=Confluentibacter citreus TaxID=2007307 RepID=UPI00138FC55B|nr:SGNH/GDSL hydrolase family protein [Confluentibacter citreus]